MFHVKHRGVIWGGMIPPSPIPLPTYPPTQIPPYVYVYIRTRFFPSILEKIPEKIFNFSQVPPPYIFNDVLKKKFRKKFSGNFETSLCYKFFNFSNRQKLVSRLFTLFFKPINSILNVYATYINLIISPHLL